MNRKLAGVLLWAGWFLASAVICSLLRTSVLLLSGHILTPTMAQDFATAVIGIICLVVTMDIAAAYRGEPTA
ncbi:MAG: hypothetical protein GIW97_03875 [Candidatus Eremiobacteraeota bacterium]|nr:hypothetical protein [Candidatus Eremiobacteraeota bacterium]